MSRSEAMAGSTAITLRAPALDDHAVLLRWRSDPRNVLLLMWHGTLADLDAVAAWIERRTAPGGVFRIIESEGDPLPVGFVQLTDINMRDRHASLGLFVDERVRGRGVAADALAGMESEAASLGLAKIVIEVLATNERAVRFWTAAGFRTVGTLEDHFRWDDAAHDVVVMEKRIGS